MITKSGTRSSHLGTQKGENTGKKTSPESRAPIFHRGFIFFVLIATVAVSSVVAEPPVMKTLSAHVVKVAEDGKSLQVDFRHPATEKVKRLVFYVDEQTGLSGIQKLRDLRSGQVVNIDYVEEKGRFLIRYLARVKLSGPPAGLENFRGL